MSLPFTQPPAIDDRPLDAVLRAIHQHWLRNVEEAVGPVQAPNARFWERWTAARYLSDRFEAWYDHETALARSLALLLRPMDTTRLADSARQLEIVRDHLDTLGRRRGTAKEMRTLAGDLLRILQHWFAELELAVAGMTVRQLSDESRRILSYLQTLAATGP
jgi:hypothetical protein